MKIVTVKFLRLLITVWLLTGTSLISQTQDKLVLTLEDSIQLALQRNPFHLASEQRIDAARAQVREAAAGFLPALNAQGLSTLAEKVMELEFPSMIPGEPPQRIEVDFTRDYQFTMSLTIPLFTGGRLVAGFKQAHSNLKAQQEAVRLSRQDTVFNTKLIFYGILLAREFVTVSEEAVDVAEKLYRNVKVQHEVGLASQFDLLRSEVQLANLKPQLIKARNNLRILELNLKTVMGVDQNTPIEVKGKLSFQPIEPDLDSCVLTALESRPDLRQLRYQKAIAEQAVKMAAAARLPSVALSGQYNYWADKLSFAKNTWSNFYQVNLTLNIPIFNGFANSARIGQAKAALKELEMNQKGLMDMLKFEVRQAIFKLDEARESLISQEKNVQQAQESLRIAELNFQEGMITILDMNQTQAALSQAKTNYSQALYDYMAAKAELEKAMGVG